MRRIAMLAWVGLMGCGAPGASDGGANDAGARDSGRVIMSMDAGRTDAGVRTDGGASDAGASATDGGAHDGGASDAGPRTDGGAVTTDSGSTATDAGGLDSGAAVDAGARRYLLVDYCPVSGSTAPGLYYGTLADNTNDTPEFAGNGVCGAVFAPGRDGAVRVVLDPGATVRATYRHGGDAIVYILDGCRVVTSCLDESDSSTSGAEMVEWTNSGGTMNPIYVVLDSDSLGGPQTFELDLEIIAP